MTQKDAPDHGAQPILGFASSVALGITSVAHCPSISRTGRFLEPLARLMPSRGEPHQLLEENQIMATSINTRQHSAV